MLARRGRVLLPPPGGDVIGRRPLDTHFLALMELGTRVESGTFFALSANKLKGAAIFLDETSVTATENTLMAAVLAEGTTVIENAASEPHVQDLCRMLVSMGARIDGNRFEHPYDPGREKALGRRPSGSAATSWRWAPSSGWPRPPGGRSRSRTRRRRTCA